MLNLQYLRGICEGDTRPLKVEIKTDQGVVTGTVWSVELADDAVTFRAVVPQPAEKVTRPLPLVGRTVRPLPSSPYIGPNGEFYPMGGIPIKH